MSVSWERDREMSGKAAVCQAAAGTLLQNELHPVAGADAVVFRPAGEQVGGITDTVQMEAKIIAAQAPPGVELFSQARFAHDAYEQSRLQAVPAGEQPIVEGQFLAHELGCRHTRDAQDF